MAELYGGMAVDWFDTSPTAVRNPGWPRMRAKAGRIPQIQYVPVKASETIRKYDFLKITAASSSDQVERALDPAGTDATATLTGDGGGIPRYIAMETQTTDASVDAKDVIAVYDVMDFEFLFALYHATASSAEPQDIKIALQPTIPVGSTAISTVFYEWGIYEIGTGSNNYFPIVDVANQDSTNGGVAIVQIPAGVSIATDFAPVWVAFGGLS